MPPDPASPAPLPRGAALFRALHTLIALIELTSLAVVWTSALTGRRGRLLMPAIGALAAEGAGLVVGRGDCPLGPLQRRLGDPVPLFELVLPPTAARRAVPLLGAFATLGTGLALLRTRH